MIIKLYAPFLGGAASGVLSLKQTCGMNQIPQFYYPIFTIRQSATQTRFSNSLQLLRITECNVML